MKPYEPTKTPMEIVEYLMEWMKQNKPLWFREEMSDFDHSPYLLRLLPKASPERIAKGMN